MRFVKNDDYISIGERVRSDELIACTSGLANKDVGVIVGLTLRPDRKEYDRDVLITVVVKQKTT